MLALRIRSDRPTAVSKLASCRTPRYRVRVQTFGPVSDDKRAQSDAIPRDVAKVCHPPTSVDMQPDATATSDGPPQILSLPTQGELESPGGRSLGYILSCG